MAEDGGLEDGVTHSRFSANGGLDDLWWKTCDEQVDDMMACDGWHGWHVMSSRSKQVRVMTGWHVMTGWQVRVMSSNGAEKEPTGAQMELKWTQMEPNGAQTELKWSPVELKLS